MVRGAYARRLDDHLGDLTSEGWGFYRPWEIGRLTDYSIQWMRHHRAKYAEAMRALYPQLRGAPAAEDPTPDDLGARLERGVAPSKAELVAMLGVLYDPAMAEREAERQLAAWRERQKGA